MRKILIGVVAVVVLLVVVAYLLPREAGFERTTVIAAPPEKVFAVLDGFSEFNNWSPWVEMDPAAIYTFSGPPRGAGARMTWQGEVTVSGAMAVAAAEPPSRVDILLEFDGQGTAQSWFTLTPEGTGTRVVWGFSTDTGWNPVERYMGLMLDGFVGDVYAQGLANLKAYVESKPDAAHAATDAAVGEPAAEPAPGPGETLSVTLVEVAARPIVYMQESAPATDSQMIGASLAGAYATLVLFLDSIGVASDAPPLAITRDFDPEGDWRFDAALVLPAPLPEGTALPEDVLTGQTPAGRAVVAEHKGWYDTTETSYEAISAYMAANGLREGALSWEEYVSDPEVTPRDEVITRIYYLVAE